MYLKNIYLTRPEYWINVQHRTVIGVTENCNQKHCLWSRGLRCFTFRSFIFCRECHINHSSIFLVDLYVQYRIVSFLSKVPSMTMRCMKQSWSKWPSTVIRTFLYSKSPGISMLLRRQEKYAHIRVCAWREQPGVRLLSGEIVLHRGLGHAALLLEPKLVLAFIQPMVMWEGPFLKALLS